MKKILLLSYPRCGSNWVAYIIQAGMGIQVMGTKEEMQVKCKPADFISNAHCMAYKTHGHLNDLDENAYDGLVFCLRDYRKCIVNHCRSTDLQALKQQARGLSSQENGGNPDYLWLLKYYNEFKKPKMIMYYEKLLEHPLSNISNLKSFLYQYIGERDYSWAENYHDFCDDYQKHFNTALAMYESKDHPDYSELHKSFNLGEPECKELTAHIKNKSNNLFQKYLTFYE